MVYRLLFSGLVLASLGCATATLKPPVVKEYKIKSQKDAFKSVAQALMTNGFGISHTDASIGVLKATREFPITMGLMKVSNQARANVQVMVTDTTANANIKYECFSASGWYSCYGYDKDVDVQIQKVEAEIITQLDSALQKK